MAQAKQQGAEDVERIKDKAQGAGDTPKPSGGSQARPPRPV
jgi:hypothetical protein